MTVIAASAYASVAGLLAATVIATERTWGLTVETSTALPDWRVTQDGCFAGAFDPARCSYAAEEQRSTVFLVGDSYAGAVSDGLILGAAQSGVSVIVLGTHACAHLPVNIEARGLCSGRYDELLNLVATYQPALVLMTHSTTSYTRSRDAQPNVTLYDDNGEMFPTEAAATAHWVEAVARARDDLAARGSQLVIVDQTPAFSDSVVGGQTMLERTPVTAHLSLDDLQALREPVRSAVHKAIPDGFWIDPTDALCDDSGCTSRPNGQNWYFDESHLNRAGSESLAPWFAAELERLLALAESHDASSRSGLGASSSRPEG